MIRRFAVPSDIHWIGDVLRRRRECAPGLQVGGSVKPASFPLGGF